MIDKSNDFMNHFLTILDFVRKKIAPNLTFQSTK